MTPPPPWKIRYADGSANVYAIEADGDRVTYVYTPVTPAQSSTGMYSGGPPRRGVLDADTVATLWQHVGALAAATDHHVADRMKGTGAFAIEEIGGTRSFIVARGPALLAFDDLLGGFGR